MNKFQNIKNTINALTGKTANNLLNDFMVIVSSKDKTAKLCFMDKTLQYEEDIEHAKKRKASIERTIPFPTEVRNIFRIVEKKRKELEEMGLTDINARGSDEMVRNGKVLHTFWMSVPIDNQHKINAHIVNGMLKRDKQRSLSVNFSLSR